jgi:hypothetical protein
MQTAQPQRRSPFKALPIARLGEKQRQDAIVHEVLAMDAPNALCQHDTGAQIAHGQRGLLAA